MALEILKSVPRRADREYLFGSGGGEYSRWSYVKQALDKRLADAGHHLKPWTLHDLRRTSRTRLAMLGVPPHVSEAVLGHTTHRRGVGAGCLADAAEDHKGVAVVPGLA